MDISHFLRIATSSQHLIHPQKIDEGRYKKWDVKGVFLFAALTIATFGIAPVILLGTAASKLSRIKKEPVDKEMAGRIDKTANDAGIKSGATQLSGDNQLRGTNLGRVDDKDKETSTKKDEKTAPKKTDEEQKPKAGADQLSDTEAKGKGKVKEDVPPIKAKSNSFLEFSDRELKFIEASSKQIKLHKDDEHSLKKDITQINENEKLSIHEKALAFQAKSDEAIKDRKYLLAEAYLIEAIKLKHPGSLLKLSDFYNVVTQKKKQAYDWALLASRKNVPGADEKLGNILIRGSGFNDDALEDQVFHLLPTITSQFNTDPAFRELSGNRSELEVVDHFKKTKDPADGLSIKGFNALDKEDFELAEKYFVASAKLGNQLSFSYLGLLHLKMIELGKFKEEKDINQEYRLAKLCFEIASKSYDLEATLELGKLYYKGHGVKKDLNKALELFEKVLSDDLLDEKMAKTAKEFVALITNEIA